MTPIEERERQTYFWEKIRGGAGGIIETGAGGYALIVAIQIFQAPEHIKSLVVAAAPIGLFLNPLSLSLFSRWRVPASRIAAILSHVSGLLMLFATFSSGLYGFLVPTCLAFALSAQSMPILVHVWTVNYPPQRRGALVAVSMMFSIATTMAFSLLGGWLLDLNIDHYRWVLGTIAVAFFVAGWSMDRIPSTPLSQVDSQNPLKNIGYAFSDGKFGIMLLAWMFLGIGNLMLLPLRFDYLLQPQYGIVASQLTVSTLTLGIPAVMRLVSSRFWGALFDRIDFMILRIVLNALIMLSILLFFTTTNLWVMGFSACVLGAAMGGANISWSLWVTKFAPPDRSPAYMSVHTFTTGIRGILAPFLGYYLLAGIGASQTGIVGSALILISIFLVYGLYLRQSRRVVRT